MKAVDLNVHPLKPEIKKRAGSMKDPNHAKKSKREKDPNQPKRPPSAFLLFMDAFRVTFKKENPDTKGIAVVGKAGGEKWKSMTDQEKASYIAHATQKKAEYDLAMAAYKGKENVPQ
ncbi:hypothetical protein AMTRI_Chr05g57150 [Amborella trichopoda]|uniref:HMG box domain-containing protein n=1 Tax=Amborella trichopoda TaxID=13333 RepID=W1NRX0_AMBTC|nr:high mobility group B protein 1 [Amborella trichopoda]ERM98632.1 hypothetical protein AMTR_s00109p00094550 [Amborella trichopoda]|eukprot:XP_006833354.1 high mobility group B protein 1 [Amborella trichopoda]